MIARFKVVIPARYGSSRLPGKPLLDIAGKPMIIHVCEKALQAQAEQVVVATDDERIYQVVSGHGIEVVMTSDQHQSGTERLAEVARLLDWADDDIIVNLQGDEPLIPPAYINNVAQALASQNQAGIATLATVIHDSAEIFNPNAVKVVLNAQGYALYFSRAPIPWDRAAFPLTEQNRVNHLNYLRHIGIYAYRVDFLQRYCRWSASHLESIEALEQLRILWQGEKIRVDIVPEAPEAGVDTEADLQRVSQRLKAIN